MKIVILDGYSVHAKDLNWDLLRPLGELTVYDRTPADQVIARMQGAEIVLTNKCRITREVLEACRDRLDTAKDLTGEALLHSVADKLAKAGWHTTRSEFVDAPLIDELPMAVECRLVSYDPESCRLVGQIVNVSADESVLGEDGKIDPDKLQPIIFDPVHHTYRRLGAVAGNAFRDGAQLK